MPKKSKQKVEYWWDFSGEHKIVIESTNPDYPVVKSYSYRDGFAETVIHEAEKLIRDLEEGRTTIKKVLAG